MEKEVNGKLRYRSTNMKEKKKVVAIAMRPTVKDKLTILAKVNELSMSGYLEILILEQWRDYNSAERLANPNSILTNGKRYSEGIMRYELDDNAKEEKPE